MAVSFLDTQGRGRLQGSAADIPAVERKFIIEEQRNRTSNDHSEGTRFEWDRATRSAPRHGWEYGVNQRTVRDEYPGTDEPNEQVLGSHLEPFSIHGMWDDRYAGAGFAENQRVELENLVRRGNVVRISFEGIQVFGLITNFKPTYYRKWQVGYEFTFSPHYRVRGGTFNRGKVQAPKGANPADNVLLVAGILQKIVEKVETYAPTGGSYQVTFPRPSAGPPVGVTRQNPVSSVQSAQQVTKDTLFTDFKAGINTMGDKVDELDVNVRNRVLTVGTDDQNSIKRVVQGFRGLKDLALALVTSVATYKSSSNLFYENPIVSLGFDAMIKGVAADSRRMMLLAAKAADELERLADPGAIALYRPYEGESLYSVSNRFYGVPHNWRDIANRNNLHIITLTGSEVLVIPRGGR